MIPYRLKLDWYDGDARIAYECTLDLPPDADLMKVIRREAAVHGCPLDACSYSLRPDVVVVARRSWWDRLRGWFGVSLG